LGAKLYLQNKYLIILVKDVISAIYQKSPAKLGAARIGDWGILPHNRGSDRLIFPAETMPSLSDFLFGPPAIITTKISREECHARCRERTLQGFFAMAFSAFSSKPAMGDVSIHHVRWRKNSLFRDYLYQTELNASFTSLSDGKGTRIDCKIGGGTLFWLSGIAMPLVMMVIVLFTTVQRLFGSSAPDAPATLASSLMPLLMVTGFLVFAVIFARRDRVFLLELLRETVDGQMQDAPRQTASPATVTR
jgi:hypothetical protein